MVLKRLMVLFIFCYLLIAFVSQVIKGNLFNDSTNLTKLIFHKVELATRLGLKFILCLLNVIKDFYFIDAIINYCFCGDIIDFEISFIFHCSGAFLRFLLTASSINLLGTPYHKISSIHCFRQKLCNKKSL